MFYVYILVRPNGKPFYVGKGKSDRIFEHEKEARSGHRCHKCNVIRKIWRNGGEVQRYTIFTTDDEHEALAYEVETIAMLGPETLTNLTFGGEGMSGHRPSLAARRKLSRIVKGHWKGNVNRRQATGQRSKQQWNDPTYRQRMIDHMRAQWQDPDWRQARIESIKAASQNPEVYQRKSAAARRRWENPEYCEALQSAALQRWRDPEWRWRMTVAIKKGRATPEFKANMSAGGKKAWADPENHARRAGIFIASTHTPEATAKRVAAAKARWADPVKRAEQSARVKAALARKRGEIKE